MKFLQEYRTALDEISKKLVEVETPCVRRNTKALLKQYNVPIKDAYAEMYKEDW